MSGNAPTPAPDPFTHKPLWIPACGSLLVRQQATRTQAVYELLKGTTTDFLYIINMITLNTNGQQRDDLTEFVQSILLLCLKKGTVTEEVLILCQKMCSM